MQSMEQYKVTVFKPSTGSTGGSIHDHFDIQADNLAIRDGAVIFSNDTPTASNVLVAAFPVNYTIVRKG